MPHNFLRSLTLPKVYDQRARRYSRKGREFSFRLNFSSRDKRSGDTSQLERVNIISSVEFISGSDRHARSKSLRRSTYAGILIESLLVVRSSLLQLFARECALAEA